MGEWLEVAASELDVGDFVYAVRLDSPDGPWWYTVGHAIHAIEERPSGRLIEWRSAGVYSEYEPSLTVRIRPRRIET